VSGCQLTGTFPSSISGLSSLVQLDVSRNSISSQPTQVVGLPALKWVFLSHALPA
jgi:hypothetical protein